MNPDKNFNICGLRAVENKSLKTYDKIVYRPKLYHY